MHTSKKILFILLIISSFYFFSCTSIQPLLNFTKSDGSTMIYTTPCEFKSKNILHFSIDSTSFFDRNGFIDNTSFKISICVKNFSKKETENLLIKIKSENVNLELEPKKIIYFEPYRKNILARFEIEISPHEMEKLILSENLIMIIENQNNIKIDSFDAKKLQKKLNLLRIYL